jgi:hypothetical protein
MLFIHVEVSVILRPESISVLELPGTLCGFFVVNQKFAVVLL